MTLSAIQSFSKKTRSVNPIQLPYEKRFTVCEKVHDERFSTRITQNDGTKHARTSQARDRDHVEAHTAPATVPGWRDGIGAWLHLCRRAAG